MSARVASLPMYDADRAAVRAWWDVLAAALRGEGVDDVPAAVEWPADLDAHWRDPSLLLSQTCGAPLVAGLRHAVRVVGAFRYTAPGCTGIAYRSAVVVRGGDGQSIDAFRGRRAAVNDPGSQSGCHALRARVAPLARDGRFFGDWRVSGSHRRSIEMVQAGEADLAAIDCVTLAGLERSDPALLDGLRVIAMTAATPGLPLVTAAATDPDTLERLRRALTAACTAPDWAPQRAALFIDGFERVDAAAWQPLDGARGCSTGLA